MRHFRRTDVDTSVCRRPEGSFTKDAAKRKRSDDSLRESQPNPDDGMQVDRNDHHDKDGTVPEEHRHESDGEENEMTGSHLEQKLGSQAMEVSIQNIRQKMDIFTQQVSSLLEAGKVFFMDAATAFDERIVLLHQKQMEKWEQEIELLRTMDAINEDMSFRLADARATISFVGPVSPIQAASS